MYGNIFPEISRSPLLGELQVCKNHGWENTPVVVQEAACRGSGIKQDCTLLFLGYGIQLVFHKTDKFTWFEHESFMHQPFIMIELSIVVVNRSGCNLSQTNLALNPKPTLSKAETSE